jgi:hypothetical protein
MRLDADQLEAGTQLFRDLLEAAAELAEDFRRSAELFHRTAAAPDPSARRRHLEWFLFERLGASGGELAAERLLSAWRGRISPEISPSADTWLQSHAGIFRVEEVVANRGAVLSDLAGLGSFEVEDPELTRALEAGDLVVGRLFPVGEGLHRISPAAGLFRSPELDRAIQLDLDRLREGREHKLLRVAQIDLERMFFGLPAPRAKRDPSEEARSVLASGGLPPEEIEELLALFAREPFDPEALVHGVGDLLGEVLDRLAFDSGVDLDAARRVLLAVWSQGSREGGLEQEAPEPLASEPRGRVREALERFALARESGAALEGCFEALERDLGILSDEEDALTDADLLPDFPGVVGELIEEYFWERSLEGERAPIREYDFLRQLGDFAGRVGVIENLAPAEIQGFAALWLPDRVDFPDDRSAGRTVGLLADFAVWLEREHSVELGDATRELLESLREELPRITRVNALLSLGGARRGPDANASWFEVETGPGGRSLRLRGPDGDTRDLEAEAPWCAELRAGDWLRFEPAASGGSRAVRCFPPQAGSWLAGEPRPSA